MAQLFIGTGCDSRFVDLTCCMLASIDEQGDVPEATVIVSAFDLNEIDRNNLRLAAGRLGDRMRFLPVSPGSPLVPVTPSFDFPFPMLGCLVAPKGVDEPGARMLLLDSDMIVNTSLRPLFEIDLEGHPIAAVKDMLVESALHVRGREYDLNYFNTGLLLIDIDQWNAQQLGDRAMIRLAQYPEKPEWPDQDALNDIVRSDWLRLDRRWNFAYCGEDRQFTHAEYASAYIVHFSGAKPTECHDHPAVPLYDRQAHKVMAQRRSNEAIRGPMFIGCATDRDFVEPTAVMLASVDANGDVPEATVLVAAFDLTDEDRMVIQTGAGRLAERLRFITVPDDLLQLVRPVEFTKDYPLSILGKLFLADEIDVPEARLLAIDSDMIVNRSLRSFFEMDLHGEFIAAVQDVSRVNDTNYFNSGLMIVGVDLYKYHDIARRALRWIGEQATRPDFPTQDALNTVVGDCWYRLDRSWNYFKTSHEREFSFSDYQNAYVIHYVGSKPWVHRRHPGAPLYDHHRDRLRAKLGRRRHYHGPADRDFIAGAYEVLLGRQLESDRVAQERAHLTALENVRIIVTSGEFAERTREWLQSGRARPRDDRHRAVPTVRQRSWAADRLEVGAETAAAIADCATWRALLALVFSDEGFLASVGLERFTIPAVAEA